eukprot:gnl/TRDRNA2_/TRDRNA2_184812_c0_seq1.p1 gnl/TRDRNA2_/TRDRNA2_184812_c0~~gnl/TRDRNA2_/TRDRNA2_184812_c0_seq1.p1  ORF type:complete len:291 (+),score=69.95 gnl/TRDRNA2_/TRDRNA2_184812_c0_seq1:53-925(+)
MAGQRVSANYSNATRQEEAKLIATEFAKFDSNGDGTISRAELARVLKAVGLGDSVDTLLKAADVNKDGSLSYKEFANWVCDSSEGASMLLDNEDAPYLAEYYDAVAKDAKKQVEAMQSFLMDDSEYDEDKAAKALMREVRPLIKASFDRHDKDNGGTLSKEEAAKFFSNVVAEQGAFAEMAAAVTVKSSMSMVMQYLAGMSPEAKAAKQKEMNENFKEKVDAITDKVAKMVINYKLNKAANDAKAFKVMDQSGDGTLDFRDFLDALEPGGSKNVAFLEALGITLVNPEDV